MLPLVLSLIAIAILAMIATYLTNRQLHERDRLWREREQGYQRTIGALTLALEQARMGVAPPPVEMGERAAAGDVRHDVRQDTRPMLMAS